MFNSKKSKLEKNRIKINGGICNSGSGTKCLAKRSGQKIYDRKMSGKKSVEQVRNILVSIKPETSVEHVSFFFFFFLELKIENISIDICWNKIVLVFQTKKKNI